MKRRQPVRRTSPQVRQVQVRRRAVRRTAPRLRSAQVTAAILLAVCGLGIVGVSVAPIFDAHKVEIRGATFTSDAAVRQIVGIADSPNIFRFRSDRAAQDLVRLPAVASAHVEVTLPNTIVVELHERQPKIEWVIGETRYVADENGFLFGEVDSAGNPIPSDAGPLPTPDPNATPVGSPEDGATPGSASSSGTTPRTTPGPTATPQPTPTPGPTASPKKGATTTTSPSAGDSPQPTATPTALPSVAASLIPSLRPAPTPATAASAGPSHLSLPVVFDRRAADSELGLGSTIDPIALDVGYRLGNLTLADVGSAASGLAVIVDDQHGFTLSSVPPRWVAEFGFYTPTRRQVTVIPGQVRDLRSLLLDKGENSCVWVRLVADISENRNITCTPR